jgi:cytochrome c551/c552
MKKTIISFIVSALLGFGLGYLVFDVIMGHSGTQNQVAATSEQKTTTKDSKDKSSDSKAATTAATTAVDQDNILSKRGCLSCHSVSALSLNGGQVGPDLSHAYVEVESKHNMPIEEFLKKPNSAVMTGVLGSNPLTDDQRKQVLDILKKASEK